MITVALISESLPGCEMIHYDQFCPFSSLSVHQISFETKFNTFILCLYPTGFQKMDDSIQWIVQM